jgi:hypothetical protein
MKNETVSNTIYKAKWQWLTPEILATQETEIRRIVGQSQPRQIVLRPYLTNNITKKGWWSGSRC